MATVYVLSKSGKPLMPTTRCGHVRILLKEGRAEVVERKPFTIRLTYDTEEAVQPLHMGIDPGRTNIGVSVITEQGACVFSAQLETRNREIPKLMKQRRAFRGQHRKYGRRDKRRRSARAAGTVVRGGSLERTLPGYEESIVCHDIRNKEARFNNRVRPDGWLTPTANHLLQTHVNLVRRVGRFLPVSAVSLELNRFAFMALETPGVKKWQYQNGPLHGYGSVEDAVFAQQDGHCIFCDKPIEQYHHVVPRRKNGSETLANRVGLCREHHALVHTDAEWANKLEKKKQGMNKKYHALSVLNQIIPYLFEQLRELYPDSVYTVTGKDTKAYREDHGIVKDHPYDAYSIAATVLAVENPAYKAEIYHFRQFRRHDRQACHKQNLNRVYKLDGKVVATNRHKAIEQKTDSLAEYRSTHSDGEVSRLMVTSHQPIYKRMDRVMPGATVLHSGKTDILLATQGSEKTQNGRRPSYCVFKDGKERYHRCVPLRKNQGICCL